MSQSNNITENFIDNTKSQNEGKKFRTKSQGQFSYSRSSLHGVKEIIVKENDVFIMSTSRFSQTHEKEATWVHVSQWMIADIIGAGVLSISGGLVDLGWYLGLFFLIIMLPLNMYTSILLSRIRTLHPECTTMMDMANTCIGPKAMKFTAFCVYFNLTLMLGDYIILCGDVLGFGLHDVHYCKYIWSMFACLMLVPLTQFRSLADVSWLCWVNMATIVVSLGIALVYLVSQGVEETRADSYVENIPSTLDFWSFFSGLSKFMFAYTGQFMYLEIMSEMKQPEDFPKTFRIVAPFQLAVYLTTGVVGYYFLGQNAGGDIIQNAIPFGNLLRVAGFILLVHMLITYLIKGTVLARAIHILVDEKNASARTPLAKKQWFAITLCLLVVCYIIANLIPFFDQLTGLIGALVQPFTAMIIPIACYLSAKKTHGFKIPTWEYFPMVICLVVAFSLFAIGSVANLKNIIHQWSEFGAPFSCNCHDIWNTCECSSGHIGMDFCE